MIELVGKPAVPGIGIGKARVLVKSHFSLSRQKIVKGQEFEQRKRLENAIKRTEVELIEIKEEIEEKLGKEHALIIESHLMLLQDKSLMEEVVNRIEKELETAEKAIESLYKAMNFDTRGKEVSAYKSVRDLERLSKHRIEKLLHKLYTSIIRQWVVLAKSKEDDVFRLNGNIYLNPKTGKPLTNIEWKILKSNITNAFGYIYKDEEDRIALKALALGKVLKRMDTEFAVNASWDSLAPKVTAMEKTLKGDTWENIKTFGDQHAGELIVDLTNKQYKQIHDVIQTAIRNRVSGNELQSTLFDTFGGWNRDWRRIAETEISAAQNNGLFQTMLDDNGEEPTFVKGVSAPDACQSCQRLLNGKTFVLLNAPPEAGGDQVTLDEINYTAIWVGKTNYGRNRANWWAAFPMHPHCRCTAVEYVPGFEKYETMLKDSMNRGLTEQ